MEWRNVTSSEYKDTEEANTLKHSDGSNTGTDTDTDDGEEESLDLWNGNEVVTDDMPPVVEMEAPIATATPSEDVFLSVSKKETDLVRASMTNEDDENDENNEDGVDGDADEADLPDMDLYPDGSAYIDGELATDSEASPSEALPEHELKHTGFMETIQETAKGLWNRFTSLFATKTVSDDGDDGDDGNESGGNKGNWLRDSIQFKPTTANSLILAANDIIDWTFVAYDHRTEGEIHFNKRDFDLSDNRSDVYDDYAEENGDGTLEGAVYGLFAAQDIIHPDTDGDAQGASDGDTGIVFKKDDLVAVATTDRNGDGSFMAITEAPGTVYNYETGQTEHTDWYVNAPKNLHTAEDPSAAKEQDIESFVGHNPDNSEITAGNGNDLADTGGTPGDFFWKNSTNQEFDSGMLENNRVSNRKEDTWREADTTGHYPISDNEDNNGNCWIGRPLILGKDGSSYYIKELSRSEGYELSVYGSDKALTTNRDAFAAGGDEFISGEASATVIDRDQQNGGNTFTVTSSGTQNGYILKLTNIPEGAEFYITTSTSYMDPNKTHQEVKNVPVEIDAVPDTYVYLGGSQVPAKKGDTITYNGKTFIVNNVKVIDNSKTVAKPDNRIYVENPALDITKITPSGNVTGDINTLFGKSGFRKVVNGCPWVSVPVDAMTVENVAKAVNEKVFTDPQYSAFNAMEMLGSYVSGGKTYVAIGYCYRDVTTNQALYNEKNNQIYVKTEVVYRTQGGTIKGFAYRTYNANDCESVNRNTNGFVLSAIVPNETASGSPMYALENLDGKISFTVRPNESYWTYAQGEKMLTSDGNVAIRYEKQYVDVAPTLVTEVKNEKLDDVTYSATTQGAGTYTVTISQALLDKTANGTVDFRILYPKSDTVIDGVRTGCEAYAKSKGVIGITYPYGTADSYIRSVMLMYPGPKNVYTDGETIQTPTELTERPIRQKIRIDKDIQKLKESKSVWYCLNCGYENGKDDALCGFCGHHRTTEETKIIDYAHDTYGAVHSENISADREDGWYDTVKDWFAKLLKHENKDESTESIGNFRFKAYLKSNLERLYRKADGTITWIDRNGNEMVPQYEDKMADDGNYDTFTWKYKGAFNEKTVDFPEKDKTSDGTLETSNVQKIYTEVEHNKDSKTSSARANNVWASYGTPQGGNTENVGDIQSFTTSERGTSGQAVKNNSSLYSYDGKLVDKDRSDKLNDTANSGYTRILESTLTTIEDEGTTRKVETYNYEKFFDAIHAANTDVWDDDMHSTFTGDAMKNYPGQHWFKTFYEKYQKDDTDPGHTKANTDGADQDHTAGGDRDTSFKPFRWIRENVFGYRDGYEKYPADNNGVNTEVTANTSDFARANAEASDAVRQFAVKWYLQDEAAKLMVDNGQGENIALKSGTIGYDEAVYDEALFNAIAKAYNYLKPFYFYDLDTIYSVEWDSAKDGGADKDYTTLSADELHNGKYYNTSSYLPYGVYVIVEQQPERRDKDVNDWKNRSYDIEKPKEVIVPSVYDAEKSNNTSDNYDPHYNFDTNMYLQEQAKASNYLIRFGEELSANTEKQDDREFVIRAHGYYGDFEVYKYGLDIDGLSGTITDPPNGAYSYNGWELRQGYRDPLKDYYEYDHRGESGITEIGAELGGNNESKYHGYEQENGNGQNTANGKTYDGDTLRKRFFYASVSEDDGTANNVLYKDGAKDDNNASGMNWKDNIPSTTGELTAYDKLYSAALVPWSVTAPTDLDAYSSKDFTGYADVKERNRYYVSYLRINKVDSETGEYILHDDAIFGLYAASRYTSFDEIEEDAKLIEDADERARFLMQFKPGDAKFYLKDTYIVGSKEFLEAMGATDLQISTGRTRTPIVESQEDTGHTYTGLVRKGTPVCVESERIDLSDDFGKKTGQMTVWSTKADVKMDDPVTGELKDYGDQNVGYFKTSQPVSAGVYVLAEIKPPAGYARSKPVAIEVYSDKTSYYVDGDMYAKVAAVRYDGNLLTDIPYEK